MRIDTQTGPVEIPDRVVDALKISSGGAVVFECDVCGYEEWSYQKGQSKVKAEAVKWAVGHNGWRHGLRDEYEVRGWTCGVHSREIAMTDVRAEGEEACQT